jgi:hypothetical protein
MKGVTSVLLIFLLFNSLIFTVCTWQAYAEGVVVFLNPSTITIEQGMMFDVSIVVSNVQNLWAWQAGLEWDPAVLEYVSYEWGEFNLIAGYEDKTIKYPPVVDHVRGGFSTPADEALLRGWCSSVTETEVRLLTVTFCAVRAGSCELRLVDVILKGQDPSNTTVYPRWSDTNADGIINLIDVAWTQYSWMSGYEPQCDFDADGNVDITDMAIVTSDFAKRSGDVEWGVTNTIYDILISLENCIVSARSRGT